MSNTEDDRFVQEVNEELRREQMKNLWSRFGKFVIGGAVLIIVGTAGFKGYEYRVESQSAANGDQFVSAVQLLDEGKAQEGIAALEAVTAESSPAYVGLAKMRLANEAAAADDIEKATTLYQEIASDGSLPQFLQDVANLRIGQLMVDSASLDEVIAQLQTLAADGSAYRFSASEAIGLAAYKAGEFEEAQKRFESLLSATGAPSSLVQRANIVLELMASKGALVEK